jgi:hypothetical protein
MPGGRDRNRRGLAPKRWTIERPKPGSGLRRCDKKKGAVKPPPPLVSAPGERSGRLRPGSGRVAGSSRRRPCAPMPRRCGSRTCFPALCDVPGDECRGRGFALRCFLRVFAVSHCSLLQFRTDPLPAVPFRQRGAQDRAQALVWGDRLRGSQRSACGHRAAFR